MDWSKIWVKIERIQIDTDKEEDKEMFESFLARKKKGQIVINLPKKIIKEKD